MKSSFRPPALDALMSTPYVDWPAGSAEAVYRALVHGDDEEKRIAAKVCVPMMDSEVASALVTIIGNEGPDRTRIEAVGAFAAPLRRAWTAGRGRIERGPLSEDMSGRVRRILKQLYYDGGESQDIRQQALEVSNHFPEGWHRGAVRAAFLTDSTSWRATAVRCMKLMDGFEEEILESLEARDEEVLLAGIGAARAFSMSRAARLVAAIACRTALSIDTRVAAIAALPDLDPVRAARFLRGLRAQASVLADAIDYALENATTKARRLQGFDSNDGFDDPF